MATWDGHERRKSKFNERDYLLVKIDATVENILKEFKEHKDDFKIHKDDDTKGFDKHSEDIHRINIKMAVAAGFIIAVDVFLKLIK